MNSPKLSIPRSFSMLLVWYNVAVWLLLLSLTFITLFQNHIQRIFPILFNCLRLHVNWWFSWHMLSKMKSLQANFSWPRFSDLLQRFFLSIGIFRFCFLDLNFTITIFFFVRWWNAWRSSGITSWPVRESERERALQTLSSSSSSLIDAGIGFISINLCRWYWALLTAFFSSSMIHSLRCWLQFFETARSAGGISNLLVKWSNWVVRFTSLEEISSMLISSSINLSFQRCSKWLFVRNIVKNNLK